MISPVRVRRSTVLADTRPGGRLPPIRRSDARAREALEEREAIARRLTRVGAAPLSTEGPSLPPEGPASSNGGAWKIWIPLALVPIGGVVGFGAATLLGLKACSRMAIALVGGIALGTVGAATISLASGQR